MRLRNIKGAKEEVEKSPYIVINPEQYKGKWNTLFEQKQPIHVEIGMGKGNFIIENAIRHPEINFIGIEKYYSVLIKATSKLMTLELPNLKLIAMDAVDIENIFDHEVEIVYLNFSDPWPKKRHARRRLTSPEFLKLYDSIFKNEKKIIMKTDNRHLFEYSLQSLTEYGYHIENLCLDLYKEEYPNNIPTEYEQKFSKLGYPIYRVEIFDNRLTVKDKKTSAK